MGDTTSPTRTERTPVPRRGGCGWSGEEAPRSSCSRGHRWEGSGGKSRCDGLHPMHRTSCDGDRFYRKCSDGCPVGHMSSGCPVGRMSCDGGLGCRNHTLSPALWTVVAGHQNRGPSCSDMRNGTGRSFCCRSLLYNRRGTSWESGNEKSERGGQLTMVRVLVRHGNHVTLLVTNPKSADGIYCTTLGTNHPPILTLPVHHPLDV